MKMCIACGMPMVRIADYPLFDISKNYCKYCSHTDGTMKTFDEKLNDLACRYVKEHDIDYSDAEEIVTVILKKLPAWKRKL